MENHLLKFQYWTWRIPRRNNQNGDDTRQTQSELYGRWKEGYETSVRATVPPVALAPGCRSVIQISVLHIQAWSCASLQVHTYDSRLTVN